MKPRPHQITADELVAHSRAWPPTFRNDTRATGAGEARQEREGDAGPKLPRSASLCDPRGSFCASPKRNMGGRHGWQGKSRADYDSQVTRAPFHTHTARNS
jgi:hypothetical protein